MAEEVPQLPPTRQLAQDEHPQDPDSTPHNPLPTPTGQATAGARNYNSKVGIVINKDNPPLFDGIFKALPDWLDTVTGWFSTDGPQRVVYVELCVTDYQYVRASKCLSDYNFDFGHYTSPQDSNGHWQDITGKAFCAQSPIGFVQPQGSENYLNIGGGLHNLVAFYCALDHAATTCNVSFMYQDPAGFGGDSCTIMVKDADNNYNVVSQTTVQLSATSSGNTDVFPLSVSLPGTYNMGGQYQIDISVGVPYGFYVGETHGSFT